MQSIRQGKPAALQQASARTLGMSPFYWEIGIPPEEKSTEALLKEWTAVLKHHYHALPHYAREEDITLENLAWFAQSIATLLADLDQLLQGYELGTLAQCLESKEEDKVKLRHDLLKEIKNEWGPYASFVLHYLEWSHHKTLPPTREAVDWRLRPPCGEAYVRAFPHLFEDKRGGRRPGGASKEGRFAKGDNGKPPFKEGRERGGSLPPRGEKSERSRGPHGDSKGQHRSHATSRPKPFASPEGQPPSKHPQWDAAIQETLHAVEEMKADPGRSQWDLAPRNGFLRREQHLIAAQAGFETESCGEEQERYVRIVRK